MVHALSLPVTGLSVRDLLNTHSAVHDELRRRGVFRSANNPKGDYAEWLVSSKIGFELAGNSVKGFDATDARHVRYQIKARLVHAHNVSTQIRPIRSLVGNDFDILIAVVFDSAWNVNLAARVMHKAAQKMAVYRQHVNGHVMQIHCSMFSVAGVLEIIETLRDGWK
ncbi:conserved protein of unknown function [Ralstonia solanacearum CMR15]|nr:conserved protein of unknown function [Ralstonia solanacearum CMR15]